MPLQTIKSVMENPALDRDQILQMQRTMLAAKKERLERLIESLDDILQDLISRRGCAVDSLAVREIIGRYGVAKRRLCQVKEEAGVMLSLATSYQNDQVRRIIDERYGDGAAAFFARAIQSVYQ